MNKNITTAIFRESMPKFNFAGWFLFFVQMSVLIVPINIMQKFKNRHFTMGIDVIYDENARKRRGRCGET
ncbi:hypothetical protein B4119_3670 [Parageobacillus caldoxylosilyticus]|uniref:Uncharacterized protein n=1 Tax=Saccharococcus caldoxylosilyticus TaxID=81408 RepID=A0A150LYC6_9BACL|nr:hypothetical protein B4119_3670 [Parageobacillus caldoxylosilyticus]